MNICQQKQACGNFPDGAGGKVRVVFLGINASYSHRSLAAWCLRAMLEESRVDWHGVEATIHDDPESVAERIAGWNPDVVAATLYLFNTVAVRKVLGLLRGMLPGCVFVVGGPECLGDNRHLVPSVAEVAIRGEGELAFAEWIGKFRTPGKWGGIPGVCCWVDGSYVENGHGRMVESLDAIPPFYHSMLAGNGRSFVQLETSRGCPNGCLFCTSRRTRLRYKGMDRVRGDLEAIRAAGIRDVRLVDRTFNLNEDRGLGLLALFREQHADMRFHLEIDPGLMTGPFRDALRMAPAGQLHLEIGVQSLEPEVYALLERRGTPDRTLEAVQALCGMENLRCHVDLMSGLPGQTLAGLLEEVGRLIRVGPEEIQLERLKLLPGTPLADDPARWGLEGESVPPYAVRKTAGMTAGDLRTSDRVAKVLDWFHNKAALRDILRESVRRNPRFVTEFIQSCEGRTEFSICPTLESRLRMLDGYWEKRDPRMSQRVRYLWFRHGCSIRDGLCPAEPWKAPVPEGAERVEVVEGGTAFRTWRVMLEAPYYFCFGRGAAGGRALVAVYRERE